MYVEKCLDELWVGVKGQSNSEIASSPRNIFRYSLGTLSDGGRALDGLGIFQDYRTQPNYECRTLVLRESVIEG